MALTPETQRWLALGLIALTALAFLWRLLRKRPPGCGPGCGCHQDRDRKERCYPPDERRVPDGRAAGPAGRRRGWLWRGGLAA